MSTEDVIFRTRETFAEILSQPGLPLDRLPGLNSYESLRSSIKKYVKASYVTYARLVTKFFLNFFALSIIILNPFRFCLDFQLFS